MQLSGVSHNPIRYHSPIHVLFSVSFALISRDKVSLSNPIYHGIHSVDQFGFKLSNPCASASGVLGSKACATTAPLLSVLYKPAQ